MASSQFFLKIIIGGGSGQEVEMKQKWPLVDYCSWMSTGELIVTILYFSVYLKISTVPKETV